MESGREVTTPDGIVQWTADPCPNWIPEPGIYTGTPEPAYRAWNAHNQSLIKLLDPDHPDTHGIAAKALVEMHTKSYPTASMEIGSALHVAILRPDEWDARVGKSPTETHAKAWKEAKDSNPTVHLLNDGEREAVLRMADNVRAHPFYRDMMTVSGANLMQEVAVVSDLTGYYPTVPDYGDAGGTKFVVRGKGLLDWWFDWSWYCDMKSTADASPKGFRDSHWRYGYGLQMAYYERLLLEHGRRLERIVYLIVETCEPYLVDVREIEPDALNKGRRKVESLLPYWTWCVEHNLWPGFPDYITMTGDPEWAYRREE